MDINSVLADALLKQGLSLVAGGVTAWLMAQKKLHEERIKLQQEALDFEEREKADVKGGLQALLRNTIKHGCRANIKKGWISIDEKEDLINCYEHYERLGANGVIDDIVTRMRQLPTTPPKGGENDV